MNKINVFLTINDYYAKYLAVTIASIISNTKEKINFFILDGGISNQNKKKIEKLNKISKFEIKYLKINKEKFSKIPVSSQAHISNETNYRFIISSLIPELDKCIFIDADLIFVDDIKKIWDMDIKEYYMAAVPDQAPLSPEFNWTQNFPFKKDYRYVNTGVTLINLLKWREDNIEEKLFRNVIKYSKLLKFPDQDTLNITLQDKIFKMSHNFNAMPVQTYIIENEETEAFTNTVVIHWAGFKKPWIYPEANCAELFWEYAKLTPFYEEIIFEEFHKINSSCLQSSKFYSNFFERIFSIKNHNTNNKKFKVFTILGIKIKLKRRHK